MNNLSNIGAFVAVKSSNDFSLNGAQYNSRVRIAEIYSNDVRILKSGNYHLTLSLNVGNILTYPEESTIGVCLNGQTLESMRCDAMGLEGVSMTTCLYCTRGDIISISGAGNIVIDRKRLSLLLIP